MLQTWSGRNLRVWIFERGQELCCHGWLPLLPVGSKGSTVCSHHMHWSLLDICVSWIGYDASVTAVGCSATPQQLLDQNLVQSAVDAVVTQLTFQLVLDMFSRCSGIKLLAWLVPCCPKAPVTISCWMVDPEHSWSVSTALSHRAFLFSSGDAATI